MTTATKTKERPEDYRRAADVLENLRDHFVNGGLLVVSMQAGSGVTHYLRPFTVTKNYGAESVSHLTWAMASVFGYRLKDRNGRDSLAISGGGFDKADELARTLANYYGLNRLSYQII